MMIEYCIEIRIYRRDADEVQPGAEDKCGGPHRQYGHSEI